MTLGLIISNFYAIIPAMTAFLAALLLTAAGSYEIRRPSEPASLSGVAWVSNSTYLAVTDWGASVWEMDLPLDPKSGKPLSCSLRKLFSLEKREDVEDIALDPLDPTRLYVADEYHGLIGVNSRTNGQAIGVLKMTGALAKLRTDMGLESVARDGLRLWTVSEEAAQADGPISTQKRGTDVRLARFRRASAADPWLKDGEWTYQTDPIGGASWRGKGGVDNARSGVSALCETDDGRLLVLEREFSVSFLPRFRCRVYETDFADATDVSSFASLTNRPFVRVRKTLVDETTGLSMYEGLAQGPTLKDGTRTLVLVSDGDDLPLETVRVLLIPTARK